MDRGWRGELELGFRRAGEKTEVGHVRHLGPLRIQRPFYPEGSSIPHVYLLHPPGGVVGGDRLRIDVRLEPGATALLTTPAAQKLYRSAGAEAVVDCSLTVEEGAALEWLPSETIAFAEARARLTTQVRLGPGARFLGWEMTCFGRPANHERFERGEVRQRFELYRGDDPLLLDSLWLGKDAPNGDSRRALLDGGFGLRGRALMATFYAVTGGEPHEEELVDELRVACSAHPQLVAAVTCLEDVLVVRALGDGIEPLRALCLQAWQRLRPAVLGKPGHSPRIWAT